MLSFLGQTNSLILLAFVLSSIFCTAHVNAVLATEAGKVALRSPHLRSEVVFSGIQFPSSMDFLGPNDILVLEKNNGTVKRIVNGNMLPEPLLKVNVSTTAERGMLGIAVKDGDELTYVFLFYTEADTRKDKNGNDVQKAIGNRLYRYELINNDLVNPKLLLDIPVSSSPVHNGGKIVIGPDNNVYVAVGDGDLTRNVVQNVENGSKPDGRGGILRVDQEGNAVENDITGNPHPLDLYYAYGIRNSFGLDFDPLTGKLWDTENGPDFGDEINLVEPGFNSGWEKVQGIWKNNDGYIGEVARIQSERFVDIQGNGKYSTPEFTWKTTVGVTALNFLKSNELGKQYENDLFVGDFQNGNLYHFNLNRDRTEFILNNALSDEVANKETELNDIIFGEGFGGITDIKTGPDGLLYVLSTYKGGDQCIGGKNPKSCVPYDSGIQGTIFRIAGINKTNNSN